MLVYIKYLTQWLREKRRLLFNYHFWVITLSIAVISLIYYSNIYNADIFSSVRIWLSRLYLYEFVYNMHGSLFWVPCIYSAIIFWWRGAILTWLISMILIFPIIQYYSPAPYSAFLNIIFLSIPMLFVLGIAIPMRQREVENRLLIQKKEAQELLIAEMLNIQEYERQRVSRELHDETVQRLWIMANNVQKLINNPEVVISSHLSTELNKFKSMISDISTETRKLSWALRPSILDNLGLVPALRWLIEEMNNEGNIEARMEIVGKEKTILNNECDIHIFRIAQEALNNVRRHSEASKVVVSLEFQPQKTHMTIVDNGKGFIFRKRNGTHEKLGILSMQERTKLVHGNFKMVSRKGKGTKISVTIKQ